MRKGFREITSSGSVFGSWVHEKSEAHGANLVGFISQFL
jgi:hypothetical protein